MEKCSNQMNFCWLIILQAKKCCSNIKFIWSRMRDLIQTLIQNLTILFWWFFFFTSLGILLTVCFRVFDFLSKLPLSAPRNFLYRDKFTVRVQIFFIVIVFIHTFWWKGQCVSVSFKIVLFRIPEKSVFLKQSFQLEVLSPGTYKYDSLENNMERKSSKICITFNCYQIWHIRSGLYEPFTWLVLVLDRG